LTSVVSGLANAIQLLVTFPFLFTTSYKVHNIEAEASSSRLQPVFNPLLILQESSSGTLWSFNYEKLVMISMAIFH